MEPNSREFYKQCAFQKFCNTVLHNEACDTHRELRRHRAKEVTFSDMTLDEARQLHILLTTHDLNSSFVGIFIS